MSMGRATQLAALGTALVLLTACSSGTAGSPHASSEGAVSASSVTHLPHGAIPKSWGLFMVQCMSDKGWKVTLVAADQVDAQSVPVEQRSRYQHDSDACSAVHNAAFPPPKLTEDSVKDLYAQEMATRRCLEKLGIPVDPPMSEQAYVDAYLSGKVPSWSSYSNVGSQTRLSTDEVQKKCPQPKVR